MPKISDARRAARRQQILDAAWRCFAREGLHATTMDDIIRASELSAGAVYGYFRNKDDLILAALTTSLSGIAERLGPLLARRPPPPPAVLLGEIAQVIEGFSEREGFDLKRIALLGWAEAQRNETLRATMRGFYAPFREQLAGCVRLWQQQGVLAAAADPAATAGAMMAVVLGFVVEAAILGDIPPSTLQEGLCGLGVPPLP